MSNLYANSCSEIYLIWIQASPTLNLVNDCFRFVTGFFEAISTSAPHIYHSALLLSPCTSIIRKLYEPHAHPFVRVVQGLPISWDPIVATTGQLSSAIVAAAWSPCSRFIAVAWLPSGMVEVLDAVTLKRLSTFESPPDLDQLLIFSPDGHLLTKFGSNQGVTSWDLQTGGPVSIIPAEPYTSPGKCLSSTYSMDGKLVTVAYEDSVNTTPTTISTYNLLSKLHISSHHVSDGYVVAPIWTHGEFLRFVIAKSGSITIWEAEPTSMHLLSEVETLSVPEHVDCSEESLFLPTLSLLAFILEEAIIIWDAQNSKFLLNFPGVDEPSGMTFSPDGHFFMCGTGNWEVYLWVESPTGYTLHQKFTLTNYRTTTPLLSPSGESAVVLNGSTIHLYHTTDPVTPFSSIPTQLSKLTNFILEFSLDETFAVVARLQENVAKVLDLGSGDTWLTASMDVGIIGLQATGSTISVVSEGSIVTWNIPAGSSAIDTEANGNNCVQTIMFDPPLPNRDTLRPYISISPDSNYVAVAEGSKGVELYSVSTGKLLAHTTTEGSTVWFTPDGHEVWYTNSYSIEGWAIVEDSKSGLIKLEPLGPTAHPSVGPRWQSSCGYEITANGWILSSSGKQLLWLPHQWRESGRDRTWGRQFLGLVHHGLSEAVILELGK